MPGRVIWTVLMSREIDAAFGLYQGALGLRFESFSNAPFPSWVARGSDGVALGLFMDVSASDFPASPELWLPCMSVDDLEGRISVGEGLGAVLLRPPMDIPRFGRIALLRQPGGAIVGWMTPAADALT